MRSVSTALVVIVFSLSAAGGCRKTDADWLDRYKRSARSDIDLYLVPERYAVLESSWLKKTAVARFNKGQLEDALKSYGRTLTDLKSNPRYDYKEANGTATMKVGRISHSTAYDYDTWIPLVLHGKWFTTGTNSTPAHQQHIAPTLAKVIGVAAPSGSGVDALPILTAEKSKPDILVVAVIDQGGMMLLNTHSSAAPNIHALMQKSANMTNTYVGHLDAHTAVGHMAIGTGAYPVKSHVIGNTFFSMEKSGGKERLTKSEIYATKDETRVSPDELKTESLGDVINRANNGQSVIVSQSYALRASIGMAGHGAQPVEKTLAPKVSANNFVYWLDATKSKWITDTRYYSLPRVASATDVILRYNKYYPQGFEGYQIKDTKSALENWGIMMSTPAETQLEGELIRAVIEQEIIAKKKHKDGFTDLVYVSFKSADAVGHHFGYHSLEAAETLAEIDKQIATLLQFLQKNYGDNFAFVLTADHGCAPSSEISGGARLTAEEVIDAVDTLLPKEVAAELSLVRFMTVGQISLNHELMQKYNISQAAIIEKIMAIKPEGKTFFRQVLTRKDLGLGG